MADMDNTWLFFDSGARHPHENMAIDEALLGLRQGHPVVVRVYDWDPPGLSLGYFQKYEEFPPKRVRELGALITRRTTGGGAILHKDEITFSITGDEGEIPFAGSVEDSYHAIHSAIAAGLDTLGVDAGPRHDRSIEQEEEDDDGRCFYAVTSYDLVAGGRKLVGSAQRRKGGRVLHHGSIPLERNLMTPESAFVNALCGRSVLREHAYEALKQGLERHFAKHLDEWRPPLELENDAIRIRREKYATDAWLRRR